MKRQLNTLTLVLFALAGLSLHAQDDDHTFTSPGGVTYLTPNGLVTQAVAGFTVGTTASTAGALVVRGADMDTPTGVVFSTFAANNVEQSWRMHKGTEDIGHIFNGSVTGDKTFNIDARSGNLRFWTNQVVRAAVWYRVADATINSSSFNQSGYFGLSLNENFIKDNGSPGPFSLFHMVYSTEPVEKIRTHAA